LILFHVVESASPPAQTLPAGFTRFTGSPWSITLGADTAKMEVAWKLASSESGDYTVTHASALAEGVVIAISGGDTGTTPQITRNNGTGTTSTATGLTPVANDSLIVFVDNVWQFMGALSPPTGTTPTFTEQFDAGTSVIYVATGVLATAGATGNKAHTNSNVAGDPWQAFLVSVEAFTVGPESGGGRYLNEASAVDGYLLEDGSGVLLLNSLPIAFRGSNAWAEGQTSVAPTIEASTTTGDMMLLYVGAKPYDATIVTPSGWTKLDAGSGSNGVVANGIDVGSVLWATFYREWQSGDSTPTVSITSGDVALGMIQSFWKTSGRSWDTPVAAKGSDTTSATDFSLTMDANPGITVDDMLVNFATIAGNNAAFNSNSLVLTATGAGIETETTTGSASTLLGFDLAASNGYAPYVTGTASAAPVVEWTLTAAQTGGGSFVRLRTSILTAGGPILNLLHMAPYLPSDMRS